MARGIFSSGPYIARRIRSVASASVAGPPAVALHFRTRLNTRDLPPGGPLRVLTGFFRLNIWRLPVSSPNKKAGGPVSLIASTYDEEAPEYSPDGKRIVLCIEALGRPSLGVRERLLQRTAVDLLRSHRQPSLVPGWAQDCF